MMLCHSECIETDFDSIEFERSQSARSGNLGANRNSEKNVKARGTLLCEQRLNRF